MDPQQICREDATYIYSELEELNRFEHRLRSFDRQTLALFIVLSVDARQFPQVLRLLDLLEELK